MKYKAKADSVDSSKSGTTAVASRGGTARENHIFV